MTDWPCTFAKKEMIHSTAKVANAKTIALQDRVKIDRKSSVR
jgi:hypothetical protein